MKPRMCPPRKVATVLAMPVIAAVFLVAGPDDVRADPFWGAIGGSIEVATVGGIIGGGTDADTGATVGGYSGAVEGADRRHYRHRRYYRSTMKRPRRYQRSHNDSRSRRR